MHFVSSKIVSPSYYIRIIEFAPQNEVIEIEEDINIDIEMNEEINEQEEMDENHVLSDDSCFECDMEDDMLEIIYRDSNQAEINTLSDFKKMCCIYFYYTQINVKLVHRAS